MARRSDPGLTEALMDSQWNVTTGATVSCGLSRSSSLRNSIMRAREPLWIQNIRQQLNDQLKCLDTRLESHVTMLAEIQDFYRRRSEVELEYSRGIDKLVRQIMTRHKADKQKREMWPGYSTYTIWQTLLGTTRKIGRDHAVLAELYSSQLSNRLTELSDDVQRIYKKCHEMALSTHEELVKVLTELQSSMKTYQLYHSEYLQAESKLRQAENQRVKVEQQQNVGGVVGAKSAISRRFRNYEKLSEKKQVKYLESRLKAVKARNEYILCLEAANAAIHKYFSDDLHDLINTMDYGYHSTLGRALLMHISADDNMLKSRQGCLDLLNQRVRDLDQRADKQTFLELFGQPFVTPRPFELHPHRGDEIMQLSVQKFVQDELLDRLNVINERLNTLRVESDEIWKTLETTDSALIEMITAKDYDATPLFQEDWQSQKSPIDRDRRRSGRFETENFYLTKFHNYQTINNLTARLQAKYNCIEKALSSSSGIDLQNSRLPSVPVKPKRRKVLGRAPLIGRPRLFGGTIEEYVEATGEKIPLVVRSCVRMLNLYGMHHQGVFRVSGSQHEITEYRNQFERGKDPLPDKVDGKDINSVAGVLKLYFRELREPFFPTRMFDELIACCCQHNFNNVDEVAAGVSHLRTLLSTLPHVVIVIMRYLFAFLNHLSEFSDENMMDPYNLAICFGPTLLPVPPDRDQVQFQSHVNELIRTIIVHQDDIFPHLDPTPDNSTIYERCLIGDDDGGPDDSVDNLSDDGDGELSGDLPSEEDVFYESELKEAIALYDFQARTKRELSFSKGDILTLCERVSADWWEGIAGDEREGLIPDRYIRLRNRESTDGRSDEDKRKSTDSLHLVKNSRLSVRPFDDSDDLSTSQSHPDISHGTDTPLYSSGSVVWRSSCDDVLSSTPAVIRKKSSTSESTTSSEHSPGGYRLQSDNEKRPKGNKVPTKENISGSGNEKDVTSRRSEGEQRLAELLAELKRSPHQQDPPVERSLSPEECYSGESSVVLHVESSDETSEKDLSLHNVVHSPRNKNIMIDKQMALSESGGNRELDNTPPSESLLVTEPTRMSEGDGDSDRSNDDLSLDIDTALAEVMSGLELLGRNRGLTFNHDIETGDGKPPPSVSPISTGRNFKRTPDLVIGLPDRATSQPISPKPPVVDKETTSPTAGMTTAEVFANVDSCTIKKGSAGSCTSAPPTAEVSTSLAHPLKMFDSSGVSVQRVFHANEKNLAVKPLLPNRAGSFSDSVRSGPAESPPARSSSCRARTDRRSDQTWSVFLPSTDLQSDREFVRSVAPQFDRNRSAAVHRHLYSPACDDGVALDCTDLPKSPPPLVLLHHETLSNVIATLPRASPERADPTRPKPAVKAKPPVMKKPARGSADMLRRSNEPQTLSNFSPDSITGHNSSPK